MTKHETIANHLRATSFPDADKRLLHQCFLAAVGPEGAAPPVAEPAGWIAYDATPPAGGCQYYGVGGWMPLAKDVTPFQSREAAYAGSRGFGWSHRVQILPVDAAGNILSAPESVEPAGWVIEDTHPSGAPTVARLRWRGAGILGNLDAWGKSPAAVTPFPTREAAEALCRGWPFCRILPYAEALRLDAAEQAAAAERLASPAPAIVSTPGTCSGQPRVDGTRITVATLDACRRDGWSVEQTLAQYPSLTEAQVRAAWAYADAHPTPPKPPREVVGYRVRIAQSGTYGKLDDLEPGGWAQMNKPVTMTRADAVTLCRRVRKWIRDSNATEAGWAPTLHPVVRRKPRPDVAAAIAACEEGLEALTWVGGEGAAQSRECLITALAALRGQR